MKLTPRILQEIIKEELNLQQSLRKRESLHEIWPFSKKKAKDGSGDAAGSPESQDKKTTPSDSRKNVLDQYDKYLDAVKDALTDNLDMIESSMKTVFENLYEVEELAKDDDKMMKSWSTLQDELSGLDIKIKNLEKFVNSIGIKKEG